MREDAARTCTREINRASDAGIQNDSWWKKAGDVLSDAWNVIVEVAKVVVLVLGIVVLIIGGPLAWVVFAAGVVLLIDALLKYSRGEGSLWDVGLALLGCIPGTRGLTTLGGLAKGLRALRAGAAAFARSFLTSGRALLGRMATNVRGMAAGARTFLGGLPDLFTARPAFAMAGGPAGDAARTLGNLWSEASDAASAARREGGAGAGAGRGSGIPRSVDGTVVHPLGHDALGDLVPVDKPDPAADALAERLGGSSRVRFADDPTGREFDAVSDDFVAQSKPADFQINKSFRDQAKATFEAAVATGRRPYFHFDGPPRAGVVEKLQEYERRYNVNVVIDITPLGPR